MGQYWCVRFEGEKAISGTAVVTGSHHDAAEAIAEDLFVSSEGQWPGGRIEVSDNDSGLKKHYNIAVTIGALDEDGEAEVELDVQEVDA